MKLFISLLALYFLPLITIAQYSKSEEKMGERVFEMVSRTQGIYDDPEALKWVENIGRQLESQMDGGYVFQYHLIDSREPNAFATGGGYVFVTRGLLALVNNEDELACILAHEITHVTRHHSSKTVRASILPSILKLPANIIGFLTYEEIGDFINLPIEASSQLAISAYSRGHEREADKLGVLLAKKAGFDPYALPIVLQNLEDFVAGYYGIETEYSLLNDHPLTEDRVEYLETEIKDLGVSKKEVPAGTKIEVLDGIIFGQNAANGFVKNGIFCHPGERILGEFPKAWNVQNAPSAVSAESENAQSQMVMSLDKHTGRPLDAAKEELQGIDPHHYLSQESLRINGLEAYQVKLRKRSTKHRDHLISFTYIKVPVSGIMIRIVGLTPFKEPDLAIDTSIQSFRMLDYEELRSIKQSKVKLVKASSLDDYSFGSEKEKANAELINALPKGKTISEDSYMKVLVDEPLIQD